MLCVLFTTMMSLPAGKSAASWFWACICAAQSALANAASRQARALRRRRLRSKLRPACREQDNRHWPDRRGSTNLLEAFDVVVGFGWAVEFLDHRSLIDRQNVEETFGK